ncbi:MAG TPA: N-acetyltransferase [Verrucomicrobiales bacterium]|nr:N-acetyltransferase [Verrucomicrobiales bacterium]
MNRNIRKAEAKDVTVIAQFNQAMALETEQKALDLTVVEKGVRALLDTPGYGFYLVTVIEEQPVACLMITFEWTDWRNGVFWWIQSVYVTPAHRRKGIFKQLYLHVETMAQQAPLVRGLRLYVDNDNLTAQATYVTLGMTRTAYSLFETEFTDL